MAKQKQKPRNKRPVRRRVDPLLTFDALSVEGALIQPEMVARIATRDAAEQEEAAYGLDPGEKLRDVVQTKFPIAQSLHARFAGSDRAAWRSSCQSCAGPGVHQSCASSLPLHDGAIKRGDAEDRREGAGALCPIMSFWTIWSSRLSAATVIEGCFRHAHAPDLANLCAVWTPSSSDWMTGTSMHGVRCGSIGLDNQVVVARERCVVGNAENAGICAPRDA